MMDGNEATARVAYRCSEVVAIYPITPSSPMGEFADQWAVNGQQNLWGCVPTVVEMQSEGGAAGALHGSLQGGSLTTTFTASQGLLLMVPNMYKIAGELTSAVIHVAARSVAAQALSIFGDHSDVMATRATGFAMLASNSVQEAQDLALIAHSATLESRIPFLHFFDGFRTSHEIAELELLEDKTLQAMISDAHVNEHRARALSPDHPVIRGTAQNPDVFFQARETVNSHYLACPELVQNAMDEFGHLTGRQYSLFDYHGAPDATRVMVLMGSGAETAQETVDALNADGAKVGVLKVRLFRPFSMAHFVAALPETVNSIAVLDRTKEPGSTGEPLYLDVCTTLREAESDIRVIGGRYGLSSKEFTPAMVKAVFDELAKDAPKNHFTVGIKDDVTHTSLEYDPEFSAEAAGTMRAMFYGLGSDGTVGANKNTIKIIGQETDQHAQGYFVYDSKKSGAMTISHLRFGPQPIHSTYLIHKANFVACHQFNFLERLDVLESADEGATFLLNCPYGPDDAWDHLPQPIQQQIIDKQLKLHVIDAYGVARKVGMGGRINTIMQVGFFATTGVLPVEKAIDDIKAAIKKTYGKRGEAVVRKNYAAVDATLQNLNEVTVPAAVTSSQGFHQLVGPDAPEFVRNVTAPLMAHRGDSLPVSLLPADGTYPTGTTQWEKRRIAQAIPVWDPNICIQCGKCALVCPHSVIRAKLFDPVEQNDQPETFKSAPAKWQKFKDRHYTLQIAPEDCTGCSLCVEACPVKDKRAVKRKAINMAEAAPLREEERKNWDHFLSLPDIGRDDIAHDRAKDVQLLEPLFEFCGACAGCGETPYLKLLSQLFGDRAVIANATGCSSIYGGNLPTTPWTKNADGRGPAWSNSLFEDNAEFGLGLRLAIDQQERHARELVVELAEYIGEEALDGLLEHSQEDEAALKLQRHRVADLKETLSSVGDVRARDLLAVADALVKKSVWIVGGDGWAYDIGYGGLDHVLASGKNVNILVLDTEVYSNTGGQMSKSTPRGAVAKFAAAGKPLPKKDLAQMAMNYGSVYVAKVAMGANDTHTIKAFLEAESYDGPSLIIAYTHCIAHGYDLKHGMSQQKAAVQSGHWPLLRYDPRREDDGENPFQLDSKKPSIPLERYAYNETRYTMLVHSQPAVADELLEQAKQDVKIRWQNYENRAGEPSVKDEDTS